MRTVLAVCCLGIILGLSACAADRARAMSADPAGSPTAMGETGFDERWRFYLGDDARAREAGYDDATWRVVDLPHDWGVEGAFDPHLASCTGFLPGGVGWYRKSFVVPADEQGKVVRIRFDGVMNHSTVWCNGKEVGGRPYGYSSFTCDLTGAIHFGGRNVISVRVDHEKYADSRWYNGSGIYRHVFLTVSEPVHVATNGVFVRTPRVTEQSAEVRVQTVVENAGTVEARVTAVSQIVDGNGTVVGRLQGSGLAPAGGEAAIDERGTVEHPELWSPGHPKMYRLETELKSGEAVVDHYVTPFGIRSFAFDPAKGFSLNGEAMKIKGVCVHGDAGALGAAVPIHVWENRLKLLKEAGCNAIRCSHNPPAPEFLDLCDRMGFLVMDEAFDEWTQGKHKWIVGHNEGKAGTDGYHSDFEQWADRDIQDMVVRDRNHPSIIMWSIGNEIDYQNDPFPPNSPELPPVAQRLIKDVKAVDTTRPVTAACAFPATNLFKQYLDIEGYNYMEHLYAGDHGAHRDRVIYGSENSQTFQAWQAVAENDYIAGQFLWTGIDYLGEAGEWPSHGSGSGLVNLAGFPKNLYYYRKSLWTDAPMVYLSASGFGMRRRATAAAETSGISCFTNCDRVELFHDGQSLGSKTHAAGEVLRWPMELTSGVVTAVGKKGEQTVTFELKKAGAPVRLAATADVRELRSDGKDVAEIEVDVLDGEGVVAPEAGRVVHCAVTGPARIIGIENGNLNSTEAYKRDEQSLFQGRMKVYVQAMRRAGEVKVTVSADGLKGASVELPVK